MKRKAKWKLAAGVLLLLLCLFIAGCAGVNDVKDVHQQVYITYGTNMTSNEWQLEYSAISRDGEIILPIAQRQITVICDKKTGKQLWLQTREQYVDDPDLTAAELYEDNNWEHVHSKYTLYDLKGNLLQEMGERAVWTVYGDWVLYSDGKLESQKDGTVLFDDVSDFSVAENHFLLNCQGNSKVRVTDDNLQVLWERDGGGSVLQDNNSILLRQKDGLLGILDFDGTEVLPCQYDYLDCSSPSGRCIAERDEKYMVVSLQDGSVLYEEKEPNIEIYYADDAVLLRRDWNINAEGNRNMTVQMYDYDGQAISDVYQYIYQESGLTLPEQKNLFMAGTADGEPVLLDQTGQELFKGKAGEWFNLVTEDRITVTNTSDKEEGYSAVLQTMDGKVLNTKEYDGIYPVYLSSKDGASSQRAAMVIGNYSFGNTALVDLLDADGNILIEQAKSIQALDEDRFWVEKGFSQGLMDKEGNWLYEQSLFDSTVDE